MHQFSTSVPLLETERLKLRGHVLADFPYCAAMWADPLVTQFIGGRPLTEEESWARMLRYIGHWSLLGFGFWVIEEKATGEFVGEAGFADYKRNVDPMLAGVPEIGWVLASRVHGRGYATEAVRAVAAWGDCHFKSAATACIIAPDNLASIRVALKCGYKEDRLASYKGRPTMIFVRDAKVMF